MASSIKRAACVAKAPALPLVLGPRCSNACRRTLRPFSSVSSVSRGNHRPRSSNASRPLAAQHPRSLSHGSQTDALVLQDGSILVKGDRIPNIWLRDNCQCSSCLHSDTKQRLLDTFSIPKDISIESVRTKDGRIDIQWDDGHTSSYQESLLYAATSSFEERAELRQGLCSPTLWGAEISKNPSIVEHDEIVANEDHGLLALLNNIREYGFCFIDNVPHTTASSTESLLRRIAFIRETHYGGFYDFTADLASKDTAYTSIALEAHTDNTYFSDPAGLQALHILSHTEGSGGTSLLVDGFKAAQDLRVKDPQAYSTLSTTNIHAHASGNEGISIQPYRSFPVLSHDPAVPTQLLQVRWNSSDRASIELPISQVETWYDAARKFDACVKSRENEFWVQLAPGRVLLMDNWRVMHGRSAFTGKRRVCGAYLNRDDWVSRYKVLRWGRERVLGGLPVS